MNDASHDFDTSDWEAFAEADEAEKRQTKAKAARANVTKAVEGEPERPKFTFTHVADLEITEPEFLIDGWVEKDSLGSITGASASFKSFLAIGMACCVGAGLPFHGSDVKQGTVFYIAAEGRGGISRRIEAWARKHGIDRSEISLFVSDLGAQFLDPENAAAVAQAILDLAAIHGAPALIIVDTLARNFGPGDENSTKDMGLFIAAMDALRSNWPGCVLIVVHHTGWEAKRRGRGSSSNYAALDFEYILERKDKEPRVCVINTKMKEASERADEWFAVETIDLGLAGKNDEPVTSLVFVPDEEVYRDDDAPVRLIGNARIARETYITAAAEHGLFDPDEDLQGLHLADWRSAFYAKHTGDNTDAKKKAFQHGRKALVDKGLMTVANNVYLTTEDVVRMEVVLQRNRRDNRDGTGQD